MNKNYGTSASFDLGIAADIGIEAAVIYNELRFWADKGTNNNGWVYKSYAEMREKFPISEYQLRNAYKLLVEHGIIETTIKKIGNKPTLHFRFLKNFSHDDLVSEEIKETMVSEEIKETSIYTDNNHNTADSSSLKTVSSADQGGDKTSSADLTKEVFYSLAKILHPGQKVLFTDTRKAKVAKRLKNFDKKQLQHAAVNLTHSPFHMGDNDNKVKYATVDFLIRNDEQVEKWLTQTPVQIKRSAF